MDKAKDQSSFRRKVVSPDGTSTLDGVDDSAESTEKKGRYSQAPTIRTTRIADISIDVEQWFRGAQALDEKFDHLIAKLDALILVIDSCLGNVSGTSAMSNLKSALGNFRSGTKDLHRMFEPVRAAITSAYTVANKMEDGGKREALRKAAKEAEKIFTEFFSNPTKPSVRARVANQPAPDESDSAAKIPEKHSDSPSPSSEEDSFRTAEASGEHSDSASPSSEEDSFRTAEASGEHSDSASSTSAKKSDGIRKGSEEND